MARCDQCGNDYDKSFEVTMAGHTMTFDSFECAISGARANLPALRQPHHRARCRAKWHHLLLRALRQEGRRNRLARPRLSEVTSNLVGFGFWHKARHADAAAPQSPISDTRLPNFTALFQL